MEFHNKLVFLMNITLTTNKELAKGIAVDPSLVSLLRSGKRKQPQNPDHIRNMSVFFAQKCSSSFQRNALAEMIGKNSIRSSMPVEVLAKCLQDWLSGDSGIIDNILEGMEAIPIKPLPIPEPELEIKIVKDASFFFGEQGRRQVMQQMMKIIREAEIPGSILISSDDNLEWLLSDYKLTHQIQSDLMEIIERGFTIHQIMPAINFLPRFSEALQFWLPLYSTGQVKVYYYPRMRDNLYRRSMIIFPGHCVRISSAIGLGSSSDITMFSTDPMVIDAHIQQFQEHLSLCRPALSVHSEAKDFVSLFSEISLMEGDHINMATSLSPNTMPRELFEKTIPNIDNSDWKSAFEAPLQQIMHFENSLNNRKYIEMVRLATPEEIRSGKVYIVSPFESYSGQPVYTPETYILHLKNILRLMDQYENYYFVPYNDKSQKNYNLIVDSDGMALLVRASAPPLMLEIRRPELIIACQEHLLRKAEKAGYDGIYKAKNRHKIQELIKELLK